MTKPVFPVTGLSFLRDRASWRRAAGGAVVGALLGVGYWLLAPAWYQSVLTVVPAKSPGGGGIAALLSGELGGFASAVTSGAGQADAARINAVLQSVAVTDAVIDKFDLLKRYGVAHRERARDRLWQHCSVKTLVKPNLVQLSCEDKDPKFVQSMLTFFAQDGNEVFRRVSVGSATEEVRYLERRVAELRKQAEDSAARMREFQEKHGIVDLDSQARALVSSIAAVNAQKVAKKMELGYARRFSSPDEPGARQMESQLSVMEDALRELEIPQDDLPLGDRPAGKAKGLLPPAAAVPQLRAEYEKLYRDRKVAEATLIFALDRLESARAAEARDVSTFQVLDPPALPTKPSRPRGSESLFAGAVLGLAAGLVLAAWKARAARA